MKVCIFGAGAVGGYAAARLLQAGKHDISLVARGEQLRAIRADGLRLVTASEDFVVQPHAATDRPGDLPPQDLVLVTLKSHSQPAAAADIASLLAPGATVVFVNNGIPWWWSWHGAAGDGGPLPLLDPEGSLWRQVQPARVLGCVVYSANEVVRPGVVRHSANNRWILGEPDGTLSARLQEAAEVLREAGLNAEAVPDIRRWVWTKLMRNAAINTVCALTRLPVDALSGPAGLVPLCDAIVEEIAAIAAAHGVDLRDQVAATQQASRVGAAVDGARVSGVRPSMLQDVEQGRRLEVEAILGQVQAFARERGVASPTLDVLVPLLRGLDRGCRLP